MDNFDNNITFMDALLYAMDGESPSKAIENQEKRGQQMVVRNQRLPKRVNDSGMWEILQNGIDDGMSYEERREITTKNNLAYTKQQYEKWELPL